MTRANRRRVHWVQHPATLLAAYLLVALLPLGLAVLQNAPPRPFRDELSSALALIAFAMLLVEFVLSGRFRVVSAHMGIDLTMRFHQLVARSLTVFILVHPFLYVTPIAHPRPWDTTGALTLGLTAASTATGIVGWLLLVALVVSGIYRDKLPYRYETWRLTHGLGAGALAVLGAHHALEAGRYSGHDYLAALWLAMVAVALFTLLHVYVLRPLRQLRHPYRVGSVRRVALKTWELVVEPRRGAAMRFEAGQFVWLTLGRSPFAITEHPFSMSSCPADRPRIAFTIKQAGDFTDRIGATPVGARAYVEGPHGNLTLADRTGDGLVFIAGGVGLAPVMSMLRQLRAEADPRPMKLIYGNRVREQIMYEAELDEMQDALALEICHTLRSPPPGWTGARGDIDDDLLRSRLDFAGRKRWLYFVCGPAPMIESVGAALGRLGVPSRQIVSEKFSYG
ncbi:MAG: ferredoxin reductase family protein [Dongiaceae bacterium]